FLDQEEKLLKGGACFSEWCTFILKSVYDAFVNGADLATVITAMACIETYFRTSDGKIKHRNLVSLINEACFLDETGKMQLHTLRKYRNGWVHCDNLDDELILRDEAPYSIEAEEMAVLSVKMVLTVLFSHPFV
ncbi:MAG: hypothetical protein RR185_09910, partial [Angelakisella sp.]